MERNRMKELMQGAAEKVRKEHDFDYYVVKNPTSGLLELRQPRFRSMCDKGLNHPHDVCAVARDLDEMKRYFKQWGGTTLSGSVDLSLVED